MKRAVGIWIVLAAVAIPAFLVLQTYWQYLFFGALFAIVFAPLHRGIRKVFGAGFSAFFLTLLTILLVVAPTAYLAFMLATQAPGAYQAALGVFDRPFVQAILGVSADQVQTYLFTWGERMKTNVLANATEYLTLLSDALVGIVLLVFTQFFLLRDGEKLVNHLINTAPIKKDHSQSFFAEMGRMVNGIVLGQVVTALLQGALVGAAFYFTGLPGAVFWGAVAAVASIIPVLGPLVVYIPAALYLFVNDQYWFAAGMLAFGVLIISQIDNWLRPIITSRTANVHPLIPLVGALGGLKLWGLTGFIVGPLALGALVVLYNYATTQVD